MPAAGIVEAVVAVALTIGVTSFCTSHHMRRYFYYFTAGFSKVKNRTGKNAAASRIAFLPR